MTYYLGNDRNLLRTATIAASSFVASQSVYRTDTAAKSGGGSVSLAGPYTGAADATIDVEMVDNAGTAPIVSAPVFTGVGNATISSVTADVGVAAQTVVITLEDLGSETRKAYAPFQGVTLRAKVAGPDGNLITVAIDASGLTSTPTSYAVRSAMSSGTVEFSGDEWNFGAATLNVDGTVPATAPRIRFGDDPQVYRAWRKYVAGAYVYGFSPTLVRDVAAGTRVYAVSGSRTVTISNGTTSEELTDVVTLYDCLRKIRDESDLVEVHGVIVNDLQPGGQGSTDLSVWTRPYVARTVRDGTQYVRDAAVTVVVDEDAATEALEARCTNIDVPGREVWDIVGPVSGELGQLVTGEEFAAGAYSITIARPDIARNTALASIQAEYGRPNLGPPEDDPLPNVTIVRPVLGVGARNGTYIFRYTRRPAPDCEQTGSMVGGPNQECLGVIPEGESAVSEDSRRRRVQRLSDWVSEHVRANTAQPAASAASSVDQDVAFVERAAKILSDGLATIVGGTLQLSQWAANTSYTVDAMREPSPRNGYRYAVNDDGTSHATTQPTWPTTIGDTVSDGTVTWECIGKVPLGMWDDAFALLQADAEELLGRNVSAENRVDDTPYDEGARIAVTVNEVSAVFECTTAGTSGSTAPSTWATEIDGTTSDGTVVWTRISGDASSAEPIDDAYYERYVTAMNAAIAAAGLAPNFEDASTGSSDGCWRDDDDTEFFWECAGYAPALTGVYYHSSRHRFDERGNRVTESTREFAFGIRVGCPELLKEGDLVTITINGVAGIATFQQGDRITIDVTRAVSVEFGGGQDGTDEYRLSVVGSVFGRAEDYVFDRAAPAAYSDAGISFLLSEGGIPLALGDRWEFAVEAGRFRWRKNGGGWSSNTNVAPAVELTDGLSAVFAAGTAPSWVAPDRWSFAAEAVAGPEQLRQPIGGALEWASSISLTITTDGSDIGGVLIAGHTIPSDATITLQGSDNNFASTPLNVNLTWRAGEIWYGTASSFAKYRIIVNRGGSIGWLWIGDPLEMMISATTSELGQLTKRYRLPGLARRAALGCTIAHDGLTHDSVGDLIAMLEHACEHDDRRIGIVPNSDEAEASVVMYEDESLEISDVHGFQPRDTAYRLQSVSMTLVPTP